MNLKIFLLNDNYFFIFLFLEKLSENLADLTCDISLKEKLIRQLEISQKRLQNMRQHYEEKITQLQTKILETERERDKILSNLSSKIILHIF